LTSNPKNKMYHQYTFLTNIPYTESYKYKNVFQIIPSNLSIEEESKLRNCHYLNYLEINLLAFFELVDSDVNILNVLENYRSLMDKNDISINLSQAGPIIFREYYLNSPKWLIIKLLSVFTNYFHFDYSDEILDGWFRKLPPNEEGIEWGKKWLPVNDVDISLFSSNSCNKIEKCLDSEYSKIVHDSGTKIIFPESIDEKFDNYFNASKDERKAFNDSIVLFNHAMSIHENLSSLAIVSLVSAIENLVNFKHRNDKIENCECCGQPKYRVTKKFNDFIKDNTEGYLNESDIKKYIGDIYSRRSSIVHSGKLFVHERGMPLWEANYFESIVELKGTFSLVRYILNFWIKTLYLKSNPLCGQVI
jgi:hypothetical protein